MFRIFGLVCMLLGISVAAAQAWDNGGHLLVNQIASRHLRPEVVRQIEPLLPLLDTRGHGNRPYDFVSAGTWLDDMRSVNREWSTWHYVDVPCAGDVFVEPKPPHALWALDRAVAALRSKGTPPQARAEALGQVIHLVADIHQPVHTASRNGDRGGNGVAIEPMDGLERLNLHAFWDAAYRFDSKDGQIVELWSGYFPDGGELRKAADALLAQQAPGGGATISIAQKPWHQWARETHALACKAGWPNGAQTNGEPVALTPAFIHEAHGIAAGQIVKAGLRLAGVLNEALGK